MAKAKPKPPKTFMLRKMPYDLHHKIRIEAAKRDITMEDCIYELLKEVLKNGKD